MNIVLDCMGGDNAPHEIICGAINALKDKDDLNIIFVGDHKKINVELLKYKYDSEKISVINAEDVITGDDEPVKSIRNKKNSSMVVALNEIKNNNYDAVISAGNTGAFLAGCLFIIGRIKGVDRPVLAPIIPNKNGQFVLLDGGANTDCKINNFIDFSKLGSAYYEAMFGEENPVVKILNIGSEEGKGNILVKNAYEELKKIENINFKGNIEARDILNDDVHVVVCDGFTGNVTLKLIEGVSKHVVTELKENINKSFIYKMGAVFLYPIFKSMKKRYDHKQYGGAMFLGVNKICVKAHGDSDRISMERCIDVAYKLASKDLINSISKKIELK